MTIINDLTAEQKAFLTHAGGAFIHACPGAGKTRSIIARLARIVATLPPRHGVAVLSFTNSAVEEFRERCAAAGLNLLLRHPNFIGTLDAFVRHFIVLPSFASSSTTRPIILDSWDALGIEIRLTGQYAFRGEPVSLDLFDPETNAIDPNKIGHTGLQNHVRMHQARYQQAAAYRRNGLLRAGYMSAGDARVLMLQTIRDPVKGVALGRALSSRFNEIMVDEGQDCNPLDLEVLSWLRSHGLHVTFVCDPNQSIYEFRNGNPRGIQDFKVTYPEESRRSLTGNFRSSPAICRLAATLRPESQVDQSLGASSDIDCPAFLLTYRGQSPTGLIGQAFIEMVAQRNLESTGAIILAHSGKVSQRAAGISLSDSGGNSRIESLARDVGEFWLPTITAREREAIVQKVEKLLLDITGLRLQNEHLMRTIEAIKCF